MSPHSVLFGARVTGHIMWWVFVALVLFVIATPGAIDGVFLHSTVAMVLVLVGVAIREVWMRAGAPRAHAESHE